MQSEAGAQVDGRAADFRWQRQRVEFRIAAREGGVHIADHPCVDRPQVIGVVIINRVSHTPLSLRLRYSDRVRLALTRSTISCVIDYKPRTLDENQTRSPFRARGA